MTTKYPYRINGKLTGWSRWPNKQSSTPIDQTSQEWLDFIDPPARSRDEIFEARFNRDPAIKALIDQLEEEIPGFTGRAKAKLIIR